MKKAKSGIRERTEEDGENLKTVGFDRKRIKLATEGKRLEKLDLLNNQYKHAFSDRILIKSAYTVCIFEIRKSFRKWYGPLTLNDLALHKKLF